MCRACRRRAGSFLSHLLLATALVFFLAGPSLAQAPSGAGPWFGLVLPPGLGDVPAVMVGPRTFPATVPAGEEGYQELEAARIRADLETIVGFSLESRDTRELGGSQLWGRVSGFPSSTKTIEWAVEQFRDAGIQDVRVQKFDQAEGASMRLPVSWEVRLLGDDAFGAGSDDVVLESAMPIGLVDIPGGSLEAPLVFVGTASPAELAYIDVRGKVAVQVVTPQGHTVFERGPAGASAAELLDRGAVAVLNALRLPGNEHARDLGCGGGLCYNLGGRDGFFLEGVLDAAAAAGLDAPTVRLSLATETRSGLSAESGVAVIPGASDEVIVIDAHGDAWFEGAGDNGDGFAVMVALARHFAKPENRPGRTLVFVASAGHHSSGLSGPSNFVAMNPDLMERAVLAINIEHVATRNVALAREVAEDGYREWVADSGEAPIVAGITNDAPFVHELLDRGVARYGTNLISEHSTTCSGECGGFRATGVPVLTLIQSPPSYHTSGDNLDLNSTPGLERVARLMAFFLDEAGRAPRERFEADGGR